MFEFEFEFEIKQKIITKQRLFLIRSFYNLSKQFYK